MFEISSLRNQPVLISLFRPFVAGSDDSGWDCGFRHSPATAQITLSSVKAFLSSSEIDCHRDVNSDALVAVCITASFCWSVEGAVFGVLMCHYGMRLFFSHFMCSLLSDTFVLHENSRVRFNYFKFVYEPNGCFICVCVCDNFTGRSWQQTSTFHCICHYFLSTMRATHPPTTWAG